MRLTDWYYERRLGLESSVNRDLADFGIDQPSCHQYVPTPYDTFRKAMKLLPHPPQRTSSWTTAPAKAAAPVLAATYPFRKVIGVSLVPDCRR